MEAHVRMKQKERLIAGALLALACIAVAGVILIVVFVFKEGWPVLIKYGPLSLAAGHDWQPTDSRFGLLPLIIGSAYVTLSALVLGVPLGVGCAVFMAEIAPNRVTKIVRPAINLLAGIPSVVYGFFGLVVLIPALRGVFGGVGFSLFAGGVILAIMILPTIISINRAFRLWENNVSAVH